MEKKLLKIKSKIILALSIAVAMVLGFCLTAFAGNNKTASAATVNGIDMNFINSCVQDGFYSSDGPIWYDGVVLTINGPSVSYYRDVPYGSEFPSIDSATLTVSANYPFMVSFNYFSGENYGTYNNLNYAFQGFAANGIICDGTGDVDYSKYDFETTFPNVVLDKTENASGVITAYYIYINANNFPEDTPISVTVRGYFTNGYFGPLGSVSEYATSTFAFMKHQGTISFAKSFANVFEKTDLTDEEMYQSGYNLGYAAGRNDINNTLIDETRNEALREGYQAGYSAAKAEEPFISADIQKLIDDAYNSGYDEGLTTRGGLFYDGYSQGYSDASLGLPAAENPQPITTESKWYNTAWEYFVNWIKVYWWVVVVCVACLALGIVFAVRRRRW